MRRGKLTPEQAAEHPQRSIITRALGIEPDVEVDTWTYPGRAGDVVLLCSDGLTSMIDEELVAEVLARRAGPRPRRRAPDRGRQRGGRPGQHHRRPVPAGRDRRRRGPRTPGRPWSGSGADDDELIRPSRADGAPAFAAVTEPPTAQMTVAAPVITRDRSRSRAPLRAWRAPRAAPRPGQPAPAQGEGPLFKVVAALFSIAIVLFLFGGGGYLATRELFFVGTNSDGIVTLYSGLPYDFIVPVLRAVLRVRAARLRGPEGRPGAAVQPRSALPDPGDHDHPPGRARALPEAK